MEQIEVGSVFSGLGGIEYGFEQAGGFKTIWNCETDPYASAILKKHWSSVPNLGNIKEVDWTSIRRPDLICGGFPCQDISNAGKRAGITGERSGLWKEYAKAIGILRPRYVFIENVSALTGRGLNVVLADLASCGYDAEWDCIPAQAVGAPHRRDRLFIVAYTNSSGLLHRQAQEQPTKARLDAQRKSVAEGSDVPDTKRLRCECGCDNKREHQIYSEREQNTKIGEFREGFRPEFGESNSTISDTNLTPTIYKISARRNLLRSKDWWETEPSVGRVVNGLPNRIHRIKCLGNAVVPQVAQFIAERIKKREEILR